jgi:hypothetical protein
MERRAFGQFIVNKQDLGMWTHTGFQNGLMYRVSDRRCFQKRTV